jgi:hypothetical protein
MFNISQNHWSAFSSRAQSNFELRAVKYLCKYFPDKMQDLSVEQRHTLVRSYTTKASGFGLTSEQAVICFAHLCLLVGDDFELREHWDWIGRMLRDKGYDQNFRAKLALHCASDFKLTSAEQPNA